MDTGFVTMKNETGEQVRLHCNLTQRQKEILLAGGLLEYTREANA